MPWDLFLKTFMNFQFLDEKARRQRSHTKGLLARVRDPQQSEGQASILGDQPVGLRIRSKAGQATPQGVSGIS